MVIVKTPYYPPATTVRNNTVRWLAGIAGELQQEIARLVRENQLLRARLRGLSRQSQQPQSQQPSTSRQPARALAAKAGGRP